MTLLAAAAAAAALLTASFCAQASGGEGSRWSGGVGFDMDIFAGSAVNELGSSQSFNFLPTFYVDQAAAAGIYTAKFSLVNLGHDTSARDGGSYVIDLTVPTEPVPEPQTWALLGAGLLAIGQLQRRRRKA